VRLARKKTGFPSAITNIFIKLDCFLATDMKKLIFTLSALAILASCSQPADPAFCWTCTQGYIYNSTDTTVTTQKVDTTHICDYTQSEIDQHEANNPGQIYNTYTKQPMLCERDQ
jgi:hypothetical protein